MRVVVWPSRSVTCSIGTHATPNALRRTAATVTAEETETPLDDVREGFGHDPRSKVLEAHYVQRRRPSRVGVALERVLTAEA